MADKPIDKKEDEIRVIQESEEEVVRLDVAKMAPIEKKGVVSHELISPMDDMASEAASGKQAFDPETEWSEEEEETGKLDVPIGWFILLGVGLLGVLIWVFFQTKSDSDEAGDLKVGTGDEVGSSEGVPKVLSLDEEIASAKDHFDEMEKVVANFLGAGTVEEKVKYVRHPERVLPLMKRYYEVHPLALLTYKETAEYHIVSLDQRPFIALKVDVAEGEGVPLLVEDLADGVLIDWESYVCYQPIDPEEYVKDRPTRSYSFRVYAQKDQFYTYEFADESKYECYRLTFRDSPQIMYGFVERGGVTDQKLGKVFSARGGRSKFPLIVTVRFLEGGKASRSVLIDSLNSKLWAFAQNPEEVATAEQVE